MKTAFFAALALCLALLPWSPAAQDPRLPRIRPNERQQLEIERIQKEIQGLWRIERIRIGNTTFQGGQMVGYMLAGPNHMSLEFHIENFPKDGGLAGIEYLFQTGIYEYRFSALGEFEAFSKIGTTSMDGTMPDFDRAGERRVYSISIGNDRMKLDRTASTLSLIRVSRPAHTIDQRQGD